MDLKIEVNNKRVKESESASEKFEKELEKLQQKYNSEVKVIEKENEKLKKIMADSSDMAKINQHKVVSLEIENEDYERNLRYG